MRFRRKENSDDNKDCAGYFRVPELVDADAGCGQDTAAIGDLFLEQFAVVRVVFLRPVSDDGQSESRSGAGVADKRGSLRLIFRMSGKYRTYFCKFEESLKRAGLRSRSDQILGPTDRRH